MADNEATLLEKEQSLDFLSASFDPHKALYTKDLKPPIPSIQVFNNLGEYARIIKEGKPKAVAPKDPRKIASLRRASSKRTRNLKPEYKPPDISTRLKAIATTTVAQGDSLSSEKRVSTSGQDEGKNALGFGRGQSRKKRYMNVLEKMDACATGPLSILYKSLDKRYKVQVWIRKYKGLRSVLTGYVIAFDKHMNLALMDVDEVYTTEELHRNECCTKKGGKTKKKKKKKRKQTSHINQIKENLMDTDKKDNISVRFTPPCDKIIIKSVLELKENFIPPSIESTTAQDVGTDLTQVVDLNRPFKSLKSDYDSQKTVFKSSGEKEGTQFTIMKDKETSSSLVTNKASEKTGMLSADQLAVLSRQWAHQQRQESKNALDSQQQINDLTEGSMDINSEQTGYLFSHDLKVRVPAQEDMESQDVEFTVVGIFQPASVIESNEDRSAMLPDNLEINVPVLFSDSIVRKEGVKDHTAQLDKPVTPDTGLVLPRVDKDGDLKAHSLQSDNPVLPVSEPALHSGDSNDLVMQLDKPEEPVSKSVLHGTDVCGDSNDQVMQLNKPEEPVSKSVLHSTDVCGDSNDQVMQLDKPEEPVSKSVLHSTDVCGDSNDQVKQLNKPEEPVSKSVLHSTDICGDSNDLVIQLDKPEEPVSEPVLHGTDIDGDANNLVLQLDEPEEPVSKPVLHSTDVDDDSNDQIMQLEKPEKPVSEQVMHINDRNEQAKDKVIQSNKLVIPTAQSFLNIIDLDGSTALNDESLASETGNTNGKSLVYEGRSEERDLSRVCDFSDNDITTDNPNDKSVAAVGSDTDENSIICERNPKEGDLSLDLFTLNPERSIPQKEVRSECGRLGELDARVASEEEEKTARLQVNTVQNEDKSSSLESEDVKKTKEICLTIEENKNNWNNKIENQGVSENIGIVSQEVRCCDLEKDKVGESSRGEPRQKENTDARQDSRCQLDGKNKGIEGIEKGTQPSEAREREGVAEEVHKAECEYEKNKADEDKATESEKEEGEITSSDDEEPAQNAKPQVDQPRHGETKDDQPKKLSVWDRLGVKGQARKEETARRGGGQSYEKKRVDEKKRELQRNKNDEKKSKDDEKKTKDRSTSGADNKRKEERERNKEKKEKRDGKKEERNEKKTKDDEKKTKDQRRSTSRDNKRKEEGERKTEGKEKRDMKKEERRGSVGSEKEKRKYEVAGMKRRERRSTGAEERNSVSSDVQSRMDKERTDKRKQRELTANSRVVKDDAEVPSRGANSNDKQSRKEKKEKMDGKTSERRSSACEEKERRRPSRVSARDEATAQRLKKDKDEKRSGEREKRPNLSSTEMKKNEAKQMGSSSDGEKYARRNKEKNTDEVKGGSAIKTEAKKEVRTVQPQGDRDSERRSKNNTHHDVQARRESRDRKEKKEATLTRISVPQGDQPKHKRSSDAKQLVLKEASSNHNKAKEISKGEKIIEISKPEKGVRLTEQKKHRQPKGEVSERSEHKPVQSKPQRAQPREHCKEDKLSDKRKHKDAKVDKTQETQSEKSSSEVVQGLRKEESRKGAEVKKKFAMNRLDTSEWETINKGLSTGERLAKNMKSNENTKAKEMDVKQVKVGLLPTPVLEMKPGTTSSTGKITANEQHRRNIHDTRNISNESIKMKKNEKNVQKSLANSKKRKLSMENRTVVGMKRQKRTDIIEESSSNSLNMFEQFKDTRKKVKSASEVGVKTTRGSTKNERSSKKDMGREGRKEICTARRFEVGMGKYLEFKRRHVNQLFVRGDNVVMIAYAT